MPVYHLPNISDLWILLILIRKAAKSLVEFHLPHHHFRLLVVVLESCPHIPHHLFQYNMVVHLANQVMVLLPLTRIHLHSTPKTNLLVLLHFLHIHLAWEEVMMNFSVEGQLHLVVWVTQKSYLHLAILNIILIHSI